MKSEQELIEKAMSDFNGKIPSAANWLKSRLQGAWRNGFLHGYQQGFQDCKADIKLQPDGILDGKQVKSHSAREERPEGCLCDDTAIKHLHLSGWLPEHDRVISEAAHETGFNAGLTAAWDVARKLRHPSYSGIFEAERKEIFGYEISDNILTNLSAREAYQAVHEYGLKQRDAAEEKNTREKHDLTAGDCVFDPSGNFCVVTQIGTAVHVLYPNGKTHKWNKKAMFRSTDCSIEIDALKMLIELAETQP